MIETVILVVKTHLDIGFTDTSEAVVNRYLREYLPRAVTTARQLRETGAAERLVWTTGSWLIYEYLQRMPSDKVRDLESAIVAGEVAWHALPFTFYSELLTPELFCHALHIARRLDERFGRRTIAAKMTDVPGHSRGIVPLLAKAGVRMLHIGVNPASTPPDVPPVFLWRVDGSEVVVVYDSKDYGDVTTVPGLPVALAFLHTRDNEGVPDEAPLAAAFRELSRRFPGALVRCGTLDDFARSLEPVWSTLPVVEDEIGDTWIHGAATDPSKLARFRALSRMYSNWIRDGIEVPDGFADNLLLVAEHTWGKDVKLYLDDWEHWHRKDLESLRTTAVCRSFEESWNEQRAYLDRAVECLPAGLRAQAESVTDELGPRHPVPFVRSEKSPNQSSELILANEHLELTVDSLTGAIVHLCQRSTGRIWADADHPLMLARYQTFSPGDYERFADQYLRSRPEWAIKDFTKPGMPPVPSGLYEPVLRKAHRCSDDSTGHLLLILGFDRVLHRTFGAPGELTLEFTLENDAPVLHAVVQWFSKPACRLPEATWVSFVPLVRGDGSWSFDKLGVPCDPRRVVRNGNRHLHAVGLEVRYGDTMGSLVLDTPDAALVAPGDLKLLEFDNHLPDPHRGVHVNLHNNVWGTNFPLWYEEDACFRFSLTLAA
jgi:hypothetical protein